MMGPGVRAATGVELVSTLAEYGLLAASPHNTQPWRVSLDEARLRIFPDRSRQLAADSTGRELFLGLGCYWGNVRLAARALGITLRERVDGEQVEVEVEGTAETRDERTLSAIRSRRNNRFPLDGPLDSAIFDETALGGLEIRVITDPGQKAAVADIARDAFGASLKDRAFRAELADWVRPNTSSAKDGMPGYVMGFPTLLSYIMPLIMRFGVPPSVTKQEGVLMSTAPAVVAICGADERDEWINAGRVFQELAVHLELQGVTTAMNAAPIETAGYSEVLRTALGTTKHPLMLFRAGRPTRESRPPPRRTLADITSSTQR